MAEVLIGVAQMRINTQAAIQRLIQSAARALYEEASIEMTEAKRRTPVDTGALKASGMVLPPATTGRDTVVQLQFGGPAVGYATYVHENLEALHPNGGQAKFLESTLLESAPFLSERIAKRILL